MRNSGNVYVIVFYVQYYGELAAVTCGDVCLAQGLIHLVYGC